MSAPQGPTFPRDVGGGPGGTGGGGRGANGWRGQAVRRRASARAAAGGVTSHLLTWGRSAHVLAAVLGVLAALGLLGATLSFTVDLFVAPWRLFTADSEESLHLVASVIGLAGAFQLWRYGRRALVLIGLALNVAATLALSRSSLGQLETLVPMLTWLLLAALTVFSRPPPSSASRPPT